MQRIPIPTTTLQTILSAIFYFQFLSNWHFSCSPICRNHLASTDLLESWSPNRPDRRSYSRWGLKTATTWFTFCRFSCLRILDSQIHLYTPLYRVHYWVRLYNFSRTILCIASTEIHYILFKLCPYLNFIAFTFTPTLLHHWLSDTGSDTGSHRCAGCNFNNCQKCQFTFSNTNYFHELIQFSHFKLKMNNVWIK